MPGANQDVAAWVAAVRAEVLPGLAGDARFPNAQVLIDRFQEAVGRWEAVGDDQLLPLIHDGNEVAAAATILMHVAADNRLEYERRLGATRKSIDFVVETATSRSWIDFKTVAPRWQDDAAGWARFCQIAQGFPANARLVVDQQFGGAGLAGQEIKARWTFIQRTLELEEKVDLLLPAERGDARLMICSNGAWHHTALEDFADFYRTGRCRADDWAQNAISRFMADQGLNFRRNLDGFSFIRRKLEETIPNHFVQDVRGPRRGYN